MKGYFSEQFEVSAEALNEYGAFDVSLVTDLPLFIDPFLLFNSKNPEYQALHEQIVKYLKFLRDKADSGSINPGLLEAWFTFREVKQTWLGFTKSGNKGSGLGDKFASSLHESLHRIFGNFGNEKVTKGSHLEKLCLIKDRVGKDNISDFTTNLIKGFLCEYTQAFAIKHVRRDLRKKVNVAKARFSYDTESWESVEFDLPWVDKDFVLLTPSDLLTKDDTWINKSDLVKDFESIPQAIPNHQLRAQIDNYFRKILPKHRDKDPSKKERDVAAVETILRFPELIDYYIRYKEDNGDRAESLSDEKVKFSRQLYVYQFHRLRALLAQNTDFYKLDGRTHEEARERVAFLKDVIENKGGHKIFYVNGKPIDRENDVHIMYRLTWFSALSDVTREANDGRGPADFKISLGAQDKTIVEFKLAKNSQLKSNLEKQVAIYQKASDAKRAIKVIVYFSADEHMRVVNILKELGLDNDPDVVLINARNDDKPSGSKA